jgi:concentrative nucleoside transporter, CNT family
MERGISLIGILVFVGISYGLSMNRKLIQWKTLAIGLGLQFTFAILVLKTGPGLWLFKNLGDLVVGFLNNADKGASFVFGENFKTFFFAFKVLPTIVFFSAFISILYHYGVLQFIVKNLATVMIKTMKTTGPETLSCSANIFIGQTEAPLLIKPFLPDMTKSELHAVMTGGYATIAGGVMAAFISFGIPAQYLISASVMAAPAALAISKVYAPEMEQSKFVGEMGDGPKSSYANLIEAAAAGARDGGMMALNVAAMLIAFLGLLALVNSVLGFFGGLGGFPELSLEWIFGWVFFPFAFLMGVPLAECGQVGRLLGEKMFINEFIAYVDLSEMIKAGQLSERAAAISTFALCGFANIAAVASTIGGIGGLAPERLPDLAKMGIRAMIAGTTVNFINACIAGILL